MISRPSRKLSKSGTPEPDTMMYVINYGNSDGYALLCADKRVPDQVLAYSETGEMDAGTDNLGVQMFMGMAEDYMDFHISEIESKRDSLEEVLQGKFDEAVGVEGKRLSKSKTMISSFSQDYWRGDYTTIREKKNPLLRTFWRQETPYNNYAPLCHSDGCINPCNNINCKYHCLAGCVAVATGQLMAYHKWPKTVAGINMDWSSMQFSTSADEVGGRSDPNYCYRVAKLLRYIGDNIKMKYGCKRSGASTQDALSLLKTLGYYTPA